MKKALKITGIVLIVLILALVFVPYIFRGKLLELTKKEINNSLTAKVEFSDFGVSIFKSFPDLTVSLEDLQIVGSKQFSKDTLVAMKELLATVDIMSVINGDSIGVKNIELVSPRIHALIAKDSSANYDIMKPDSVKTTEVDTSTTKFSMKLQNIEITDAYIYYGDIPGSMSATIEGMNMNIKGNFTESTTLLQTVISMSKLSYTMDVITYLKDVKFDLTADIDADLEHEKYTLKDNKMSLNDLDLEYDGWLAFKGDDMLMDFTFKTIKTDFKNIFSLVPGVFMEGFEDIKTSGKLALEGAIKGTYSDAPETYPAFNIKLLVENGKFQYPDLPNSVDNIQMNLVIDSPNSNLDSMTIDLRKFSLAFAQNPFSINFFMKNPMTDPYMKSKISGTIDLNSIADFIPLDSITMKGIIKPELEFAGKLSDIENENFNAITALGKLLISNFSYTDADFPYGIKISNSTMVFSPQYVDLQDCKMTMGKSDFSLQGKLENFLAYALSDGTLKGNLTLNSKFCDANQLMGEDTTTTATDTASEEPYEVIEVPGNIDFVLNSTFGRLLYDTYDIKNLVGKIIIKDRKVTMDKLQMEMLGGSLGLSGYYSTPENAKPDAKFALDIKNFDIAQTFKTFNTVQKLAPIAKCLQGNFSTKLDFKALLEKDFMPDLKSLTGFGEFNASTLGMKETSIQTFAVNNLNQKDLKDIVIKNILMFFTIENGNITVKPFETNFNNNKAIIEGKSGIDQSLDYKIALQIPRANLGGAASSAMGALALAASSKGVDAGIGDVIDVTLLVKGTMTNPKITPAFGNMTSGVFNSVKDQAKQRLEQEQAKAKAEAQAKLDAAKVQAQQEADKKKKELETKAKAEAQKKTDAAKKDLQKQATKKLQGVLK